MLIREYKTGDYSQVVALWIECGLIKSSKHVSRTSLTAVSRRNRGSFLVCEDDQLMIVGTVIGAWDGWRGWIYKLAVAPNMRRKGIGMRLVEEAYIRLRMAGAGIVRAYVEEENEASLALFSKSGFEKMEGFVIVTRGRQ